MFSTLQAAFGTWPSDRSFVPDSEFRVASQSTVNEGFSFTDEQQTQPLEFEINRTTFRSDYSISQPQMASLVTLSVAPSLPPRVRGDVAVAPGTDRNRIMGSVEFQRHSNTSGLIHRQNPTVEPVSSSEDREDEPMTNEMELDIPSRSPSPSSLGYDFDQELKRLWSHDSREAFHEMVTAEGYINRYRMHMKKRQRLSHYLQHPDLDPVLCDGTKDHQTKYQAANWMLIDGSLYKKPEVGRVGKRRRHLDEVEAWEVLTREHVRSGHLGRDKLRKRLEQRYIGYTLQEIMLVLKECQRCSGRDKSAALSMEATRSAEPASRQASLGRNQAGTGECYLRGQVSNMMFP